MTRLHPKSFVPLYLINAERFTFITMEAAKLQTKKINKGKLKKTIKNVLCRPDAMFWPIVSDSDQTLLETALCKYKVDIPKYVKPHWNELKLIPKEDRPAPPKIKKVEGFVFGLSQCSDAINNRQCTAVILESTVNPRIIVQPLIELCIHSRIPIICAKNVRTISANFFGIPTSSLGIKLNFLAELTNQILEIANTYKPPESNLIKVSESKDFMEVSQKEDQATGGTVETKCPYLFRSDKKTRVFIPSGGTSTNIKDFRGQEFIKFANNSNEQNNKKKYMNMMLKRISNNPNRVKKK